MQIIKCGVLLLCVVAHTPTATTQTVVRERTFYITERSEVELEVACQCDIEIHRLYRAARVSYAGDKASEFVEREHACGFFGVSHSSQKGWLFISQSCDKLPEDADANAPNEL